VPTQHEWALLGNEGGNSGSTSSDYFDANGSNSTSSGLGLIPAGNPGIVWVPVSEGTASTSWSGGKTNGYALYDATVWTDPVNANYREGNDPLIDAGAPDPLLFLPAGGTRYYDDGTVDYTGDLGYYWSSVVGTDSYYMYFYNIAVLATHNAYRAYGMSVRCVAE
jgi:hypothetical protein